MADLTTKAPEVKKELLTLLKADSGLTDVQITNGFVANPEREWIFLGEITWDNDDDAVLKATAAGRRQERFGISVGVSVQIPGGDSQEAEDRCQELAGIVETVVRSNERLNGLVLQMELSPTRLGVWPYSDGYESQFEGRAVCTARK